MLFSAEIQYGCSVRIAIIKVIKQIKLWRFIYLLREVRSCVVSGIQLNSVLVIGFLVFWFNFHDWLALWHLLRHRIVYRGAIIFHVYCLILERLVGLVLVSSITRL